MSLYLYQYMPVGAPICEDILQGIGQLEGINIAETELNVSIDN